MTIVTETPCGPSQHSRDLAPGIVWHETASHGGYYVSPERVAERPPALRDFKPWAGPNWYEEDCNWCVVALAFPLVLTDLAAGTALEMLKRYRPEVYRRFMEGEISPQIEELARQFDRRLVRRKLE